MGCRPTFACHAWCFCVFVPSLSRVARPGILTGLGSKGEMHDAYDESLLARTANSAPAFLNSDCSKRQQSCTRWSNSMPDCRLCLLAGQCMSLDQSGSGSVSAVRPGQGPARSLNMKAGRPQNILLNFWLAILSLLKRAYGKIFQVRSP